MQQHFYLIVIYLKSPITFSIALLFSLSFTFLDIRNVRLVGGNSRCAGRVEVLHRGHWGTVCDIGWDLADAAVVCRELDCGEPVDALGDAHFGPGSGPIWTNRSTCIGSESTLKNCGSVEWGIYECDHTKDAGVICSGKLFQTLPCVYIGNNPPAFIFVHPKI
uniref:SRCR domain-containing protein n=1 Tax=Sinocyclocheilus anshuiensis TaxID=1608454 RepID=A0A671Q688_9TELE